MKANPSPPTAATPTAIIRATATPDAGSGFGPVSGELEHDDDNYVESYDSRVKLANSLIEATFVDEHLPTGEGWSHGFFFRRVEDRYYILTITNRGNWYLDLRTGGPLNVPIDIQDGFSSNIRTGRNAENHIRLITLDDRGWLFINDTFETELDLREIGVAGSVSVMTGWFNGHEHQGASTVYKDFSIRPIELEHGPEDGAIEQAGDDVLVDRHRTRVWMADGIIEARFFNPYFVSEGEWSSGFMFRSSPEDGPFVVAISGTPAWYHRLWDGNGWEDLASELDDRIVTTRGQANLLLVITIGDTGYLFINSTYVDALDLKGWTGAGTVHAVASYIRGHSVTGVSTQFERFAVWSIADLP